VVYQQQTLMWYASFSTQSDYTLCFLRFQVVSCESYGCPCSAVILSVFIRQPAIGLLEFQWQKV